MSKPVSDHTDDSDRAEKKPGLLRSSAVVATMTLLSRVLGLTRDIVLAGFMGASANADAFFVAFKIPNFLRRLFAEGAFAQAFVPVLADYRQAGDIAQVRALLDRVAGVLGGSLMLLTAFFVMTAPWLTAIFAPGFLTDPVKYDLTVEMIRITFPYLLLISLTGFCGAILNSYGRFAVPAFTPVLLNISLITAALLIAPLFAEPVMALAWGVLMAGVVQLLFQLPFLYRLELVPRPRYDTRHEGVRRIVRLMIPALFGVSVSQINLLLDTVLASFLPTGSVSWLYYSDRLTELPLGVFGIAIATVILPSLSLHSAAARNKAFSVTLEWAVRMVLLIALPATAALFVLAEPILITLFQYGELTANDTSMAAFSLRAYTLGLTAFMLIKVLAPGFYARKDTRTPVVIGIKAMVANMLFNVLLVFPLMWWYDLGHVGLALATALSAWLNTGLLWRALKREAVWQAQNDWRPWLARLLLATAVMAGLIIACLPNVELWLSWGVFERVWRLALLCIIGLASYLIVQFAIGLRLKHLQAPSPDISPIR